MFIISIDPGVTTGIFGYLFDKPYMQELPFEKVLPELRHILPIVYYDNKLIIIEQAPLHGDPEQLMRVNTLETEAISWKGVQLVRILPGEWKPLAKAQKWADFLNHPSQHIKDAYCMLRFVEKTKGSLYET